MTFQNGENGSKGFSNGSAYGDIDNDGDLDLIVNNINDKPFIYRNNINSGKRKNNFLSVEAKNKYGCIIKTKVMLKVGDKKTKAICYERICLLLTLD